MNAPMECATSVAPGGDESPHSKLHPQGVGRGCKAAVASTPTLPGAWYDLAGRISAVQAVASCALEAVPTSDFEQCNHACNLIAAMQDLLTLMQQDVSVIEKTLHA